MNTPHELIPDSCRRRHMWARAGDRLSDLLYNKLRLAKEIQLNMWSHFCVPCR